MNFEQDGRLLLEGPMTVDTVASLYPQVTPLVQQRDAILDFSGVTQVDSSALALVFACARAARAAGYGLCLRHPPEAFSSLAALYGVDELLAQLCRNESSATA